MKLRATSREDFLAGLLFLVAGLGALWVALDYPMGRPAQMGPGFFPVVLSATLALLGALVCGGALRRGSADPGASPAGERDDGPPPLAAALRPLGFILLGLGAFAVLVRPLGLALATAALVLIGSRADAGCPWRLAVPLAAALAVIAVAIFVYGLGLPFAVWP